MEQIEYTRTVVPSSMRSPFWKYFGFPSDNANNILTRQKIVCTICNTAITYNKNTSNLRTHLMSKHFEIFQRIIVPLSETKEQMKESYMPETIDVTPNKRLRRESQEVNGDSLEWKTNEVSDGFIIVPESKNKLEERKDPTGKCCSDLQTDNCNYINFEDNLNGQELVEVVEFNVEEINDRNLGKSTFEEAKFALEINNELQEKKQTESIEIILTDMVQTDLLTLDALTRQGFRTYNQQLTGIRIDEETIERIKGVIEKRFRKTQQLVNAYVGDLSQMEPFSLSIETYEDNGQDKVMNIYYNYLNANRTEMNSILYRSCTINYTSLKISDLLSDINLKNCGGIVVPCLWNVHDSILDFAKSYEIPVVECLESMLTYCLRKICESCELSVDFERIFRSKIKILNKNNTPKPGCYWSKLDVLENISKNFEQRDLEQWQELLNCIDYLKPLKMALNIVSDEQLFSCSLIRPIIIKLYEEHFRQTKYQQPSAKILLIQKILQKELYEKIKMHNFLKEATFFDPRFHRDFAFPETVFGLKEIKSHIIKRFKSVLNITEIKHEKNATKGTSTNFLKDSGKSSSLKTFFKRDSYLKTSEIVQDEKTDLDSELELYFMNENLDLDQSPALWWQQATNCYKQLSKIAEFYLTVPCCYMPRLYHLDVEQRRFILERRKHLNQLCETESRLWYLFYNNWITESM